MNLRVSIIIGVRPCRGGVVLVFVNLVIRSYLIAKHEG